jgi:hypothetical protein
MKHFRLAVLLIVATGSAASAADVSYFGKWKLNPSKSQMSPLTTTLEKTPSGDFRWVASDGHVFSFTPDGREYPWPDGETVSTKALIPDFLQLTFRLKGKINEIVTFTSKGDTLSQVATVPQTGGKGVTETWIWKRISGGPGFLGEWQRTADNPPAWILELTANGADGLVMRQPEYRSECAGKFDGKPYPMTGAGDGSKITMAFRKTGPASFEATTFIDGKPDTIDTYKVSADGRVLTDDKSSVSKKELRSKSVFERQ